MSETTPNPDRRRHTPIEPSTPRVNDEILTSREAMALLKIGRTKLWQLTRDNTIPAYRLGHGPGAVLRYKRSELIAWLDQNRVG